MHRVSLAHLANEWAQLLDAFAPDVRQLVRDFAAEHATVLAGYFYEQMLQDEQASHFLSHQQVHARLQASMQRWIANLFAAGLDEDLQAVIALQTQIGEIHARIDVPVHLVLRGARHLKARFGTLLEEHLPDSEQRTAALRQIAAVIDLAMEIMSQAYASSHEHNSRAEEAYRLFSVAQNIGSEKERQRAALLDWENQLMFDLAVGLPAIQLPRLGSAEFGLWFRHKGCHAFEGSPEAALILQTIEQIDTVLLPMFGLPGGDGPEERMQRLRDLREQARSIGYHLERLFEQANELEAGRDVLTRLLNRKFLPVVLNKAVAYARQSGSRFAVLAIDVDHFKQINDRYGHEGGDLVLQQLAGLLTNHSRGGDYVFRLGGEEFLMLLADVNADTAQKLADALRRKVQADCFRLPHEQTLQVTVSIGMALHNGHPDYQRMLRRADEALYRAKRSGRNCVMVAEE